MKSGNRCQYYPGRKNSTFFALALVSGDQLTSIPISVEFFLDLRSCAQREHVDHCHFTW